MQEDSSDNIGVEFETELILETLREHSNELVVKNLCNLILTNEALSQKFLNVEKSIDGTYFYFIKNNNLRDRIIVFNTIWYYIKNILNATDIYDYSIFDDIGMCYSNIDGIMVSDMPMIPLGKLIITNQHNTFSFRLQNLLMIPDCFRKEIYKKYESKENLTDKQRKWLQIQSFIILAPFINMDKLLLYVYDKKIKPEE